MHRFHNVNVLQAKNSRSQTNYIVVKQTENQRQREKS
jgi:hypothetical protein